MTGTRTTSNVTVEVNAIVERSRQENVSHVSHVHETDRWHEVTLSLGDIQETYRVILTLAVKNDNASLGLDDIAFSSSCDQVLESNCDPVEEFACDVSNCVSWGKVCNLEKDCDNGRDEDPNMCGLLPEGSFCTFEDGMCGWTNIKEKPDHGFDWIRHSGPSPTINTGPTVDHTLGTSEGHYMYVESSDGDLFDHAVLESMVYPEIPTQNRALGNHTSAKCKIRFYYHMFGREIEHLELRVVDLCSPSNIQRPLELWGKEHSQGEKWRYAEVNIRNASSRYALQFVGWAPIMQQGDIGIDDISMSPECFGISHNSTGFVQNIVSDGIITMEAFLKQTNNYCGINNDQTQTPEQKPLTQDSERSQPQTPDIQSVIASPQALDAGYIIIIVVAAGALAFFTGALILCFAIRRRNKRQLEAAHLEMMTNSTEQMLATGPVQSNVDMQLRCAVTELNPNYDFINARYPETQLREIPRNKLNLIKMIGQGAFGEVYEGTLRNLCANVSELPVAVKILPALSTEQAEKDFIMEAIIISKFMHKNVVKCLGVCFQELPKYIVLELLQGGDLRTFLRESRPTRDQECLLVMEDLVKLALDVSSGCHHLEEKHFVHRDIAARNCLLTSRGPDRIAKIADFGMSRDIYSSDYYRKGGKAMLPIKWMPPEAFLDGVFTTKTDVWSFGILLWEIVTLGHMPYPGQTNSDVMHAVASGGRLEPPENCPARLNKIMLMCWNSVPEIRPCFSEIIEHLDMCLQDQEVMNADLSNCRLMAGDTFKDASTLTRQATSDGMAASGTSDSLSVETSAQYGKFLESQSQEPLLPPKDSEED